MPVSGAMRPSSTLTLLLFVASLRLRSTAAFQNLFPKLDLPKIDIPSFSSSGSNKGGTTELEQALVNAIGRSDGRLNNQNEISSLVEKLETSGKSIPRPAVAPEVLGRWRLLHTTNADTSSPVQRSAVQSSQFPIYQDIFLQSKNPPRLIVRQVVKFGNESELRVDALASTSAYPLEELTARQSTGKILGFNLLGVSLVGEEALPDPNWPDARIDFVFDEGNFDFNGFEIPYPVPFRLPILRDTVKGWIDITYLSNRLRISRGNKGTTFVLVKEED